MSCGNCGSGAAGCNNGTCATGGCSLMDVHDWLENMSNPNDFDVIEVKFKGGRKQFFRNVNNLLLHTGDPVVVETSPGHHIGFVSLQGELVRLQMKKKKVKYNDDLKVIYRQASVRDIEKYEQSKKREMPTMFRTRQIIQDLKMEMKLSDVEYQADNTKATFYYSADDRVDFRELIKLLASEFRIRVEMRQISLRQEAGRLGGIGSCGRELCCSTWLNDFKSVSTSAARYQNLSLNPSKLSGQCGRLKCCLNYELETYMDAIRGMPEVNKILKTQIGEAKLQKTDIFKRILWFGYANETNWIPLTVDRVLEIMEMNKEGAEPYSLEIDEHREPTLAEMNSDLLKLDKKLKKNTKTRKKNQSKSHNKNKGDQPGSPKAKKNKPRQNQQGQGKNADGKKQPQPEGKKQQQKEHKKRKPEGQKPRPQEKKPNPEGKKQGPPRNKNRKPKNEN